MIATGSRKRNTEKQIRQDENQRQEHEPETDGQLSDRRRTVVGYVAEPHRVSGRKDEDPQDDLIGPRLDENVDELRRVHVGGQRHRQEQARENGGDQGDRRAAQGVHDEGVLVRVAGEEPAAEAAVELAHGIEPQGGRDQDGDDQGQAELRPRSSRLAACGHEVLPWGGVIRRPTERTRLTLHSSFRNSLSLSARTRERPRAIEVPSR